MLKVIQKSLLFFACAIFTLNAKITFKQSELSIAFEQRMRDDLKDIMHQFGSETKKTRGQLLNMLVIPFYFNIMEPDPESDPVEIFIEKLTPEAIALNQMIRVIFATIIRNELEKKEEGFFYHLTKENGTEIWKEGLEKELVGLTLAYQLVVYDELYNALNQNEQQSFHNVFLLTKDSNVKKLLPKPEELYALLQKTIKNGLELVEGIQRTEYFEQAAINSRTN